MTFNSVLTYFFILLSVTFNIFRLAFLFFLGLTELFAQTDSVFQPQSLDALSVSPSGVTVTGTSGRTHLGNRVHFDSATNLLFSDSGVITNPIGLVQAGTLAGGAGDLLVTDDALKRVFVLTNTNGNSGSVQGAVSYTLNIYDLNTHALLNSIILPGVLGYPTQMARWGTNGLVFVTSPASFTAGSAGVLYIIQGGIISGTP